MKGSPLREESAGRKKDMGTIPFRRHQWFYCARGTFYPYGWLPWNRAGAEPQDRKQFMSKVAE